MQGKLGEEIWKIKSNNIEGWPAIDEDAYGDNRCFMSRTGDSTDKPGISIRSERC